MAWLSSKNERASRITGERLQEIWREELKRRGHRPRETITRKELTDLLIQVSHKILGDGLPQHGN